MAQIFEVIMLCCFGASWPFNIVKSLRSRTARGKSLLFEVCVIVGYLSSLAGKLLSGNLSYVVAFCLMDILMVATDLVLTLRNQRLDREEERSAKT